MYSKYVGKMESISQEHGTPDEIWIPLNKEFNFKVDLCASDENHLLPKYYTKENSVFDKEITETSYANIEFKRAKKFIKYFHNQSKKHGSTIVILCTVKSNTDWWEDYAMTGKEIRFINGKVHFKGKKRDGTENDQGLRFPTALLVFAPHEGETKFSVFHQIKPSFYQEWDQIIKTL